MLLELMLEFHAWSTARPAQESDSTADALEKEVKIVMELEKEQGTSSLIGRLVFPTYCRAPTFGPVLSWRLYAHVLRYVKRKLDSGSTTLSPVSSLPLLLLPTSLDELCLGRCLKDASLALQIDVVSPCVVRILVSYANIQSCLAVPALILTAFTDERTICAFSMAIAVDCVVLPSGDPKSILYALT